MSSNDILLKKAKDAIQALFDDQSVSLQKCLENMQELTDMISILGQSVFFGEDED